MNLVLWILQILLALHTAVGAMWKLSHSPGQTLPSLAAIPQALWLALAVLELLCAVGLVGSAFRPRLAGLAAASAGFVVAEMTFFSGVHLAFGSSSIGPVVYWLVVAAIGAFIVYGRLVLKPVRPGGFA